MCSADQSCLTLCNLIDWGLPGSSVQEFSRPTHGVGCHFLCLGIFPVQGSNLHLLHWQADSLTPCHLGSSNIYIITHTYNLYIHTHVIFTPFQDQKYSLKGYLHFTHGEIITPPDSHNFLITQVFLTSNPKLSPPPDTVSAFSLHIATHQILDPGEGNGTPLQYSCLENPMDGGAWWAAVHGVAESRTWLSDFTFAFQFHALEEEMATHSSVLAWRIPGTGEPGGLPSMGLHRVGKDWSDLAAADSRPKY